MKIGSINKKLTGLALSLSILLATPMQSLAHSNGPSEPRAGFWQTYVLTSGAAVAEVLAFFFRHDREALRAETAEGGTSRLYDGTHWSFDVEAGA